MYNPFYIFLTTTVVPPFNSTRPNTRIKLKLSPPRLARILYIISGKDNELFVQDVDFVAAFDRRRAEMLKLWDDIGIDGVIPGPRSKFGGDWMEMMNTSVCYLSFFIN